MNQWNDDESNMMIGNYDNADYSMIRIGTDIHQDIKIGNINLTEHVDEMLVVKSQYETLMEMYNEQQIQMNKMHDELLDIKDKLNILCDVSTINDNIA